MATADRTNGRRGILTPEQMEALRRFDTCTIANAIEEFGVRLRNEGYALPGLRCFTGGHPAVIGYAATCRVKAVDPPATGGYYFQRTDWWDAIQSLPSPRIAVIQDIDPLPSTAACVGEVHAAILQALGCGGVITNGAVRNLPAVAETGFHMSAGNVAVSHAYMHVVSYGDDVEIFGLKIRSGDLLCADVHGVLSIPPEIAAALPEAAARIHAGRRRIVAVCQAPDFSVDTLRQAIQKDQA